MRLTSAHVRSWVSSTRFYLGWLRGEKKQFAERSNSNEHQEEVTEWKLTEIKDLFCDREELVNHQTFSVTLLFHCPNYSRLPLLPTLSVPPLYILSIFKLLISPTLPSLYPLSSLCFPSSSKPSLFPLVARLLLLRELFNFMPGFLSAFCSHTRFHFPAGATE